MKLIALYTFIIIVISVAVNTSATNFASINSSTKSVVPPTIGNISRVSNESQQKTTEIKQDDKKQTNKSSNILVRSSYGSEDPIIASNSYADSRKRCECVLPSQCLKSPQDEADGIDIINPRNAECNIKEICCPLKDLLKTEPVESTPVSRNSPQILASKCGQRRNKINERIANSEESRNTVYGEFPSMGLILTKDFPENGELLDKIFIGGASLLSPNILLTAAHTVQNRDYGSLKVRVGDYDVRRRTLEESFPFQERSLSNIFIHPDFDPKSLHNDLAVLKTNEPFTMAANIFPICTFLLSEDFIDSNCYDHKKCIATGWGKEAFTLDAAYSTTLRKVDLALVENDQCGQQLKATRLGDNFILDPSFVCAGGQPGMDTCKGDGGGPLMCALKTNPNQYVQVGVTSWGVGCGNEIPGVYASLKANQHWLTSVFNEHSVPLTSIELPKEVDLTDADNWSDEKKYDFLKTNPTEKLILGDAKNSPTPSVPECSCLPIDECQKPYKPTNLYGAGLILPKNPLLVCDNPQYVCCEIGLPAKPTETTPVKEEPVTNKIERPCGKRRINGVGFKSPLFNTNVLLGEFPWMVAIFERVLKKGRTKLEIKCGGSLIHENIVLTAAHCVIGNKPEQLVLRAGEWDTETYDEVVFHQDRDVTKLFIHPLYNSGFLHNDIALVYVDKPFTIEDHVDVICLPKQTENIEYTNCLTAGWGKTSSDSEMYSTTIKQGEVLIGPRAECEKKFRTWRPKFKLHESWICGTGDNVCKGDGGGPLFCLLPGEDRCYQQVGIVSWGNGCGHPNPYLLYTNVSLYQKWIEQILEECGVKSVKI